MRSLTLALAVLGYGVLLVPQATAQQIAAPPAGPDAGSPVRHCKPTSRRLCSKPGDPASAARRLLAVTGARGLGILSARSVAGRRKAAAADRALLRRLVAAQAPARGSQSPATVRDQSVASSTVSGSGGSLRRVFDFRAESAVCPTDDDAASSHSDVPFRVDAAYVVTSVERRGRTTITTTVRASLGLREKASVNRRAEYDFILPSRTPELTVRRSQVVRRGSRVVDRSSTEVEMVVQQLSPETTVQLRSETFDAFVERIQAQESGEPVPGADGPILGSAWKNFARAFAQTVAARLERLIRRAEAIWRTPNRCIRLELEGPDRLATSATAQLTGRVSPVGSTASPRMILGTGAGAATWSDAHVVGGGSARSLLSGLPLPEDRPWIEYTAPSQQWTEASKPGVDMTLPTKLGVGKAEKRFSPSSVPNAYSGTFTRTEHVTGEGTDITRTWSGSATFRRDKAKSPDAVPIWVFALESGSATWTASGATGSGCTHNGSGGPVPIVKDSVYDNVRLTLEDVRRSNLGPVPSPEPTPYYYEILAYFVQLDAVPTYPIVCESSESTGSMPSDMARIGYRDWWVQNAAPTIQKSDDPRRLAGTQRVESVSGSTTTTTTHTWAFDAIE